MPCQCPRGRSNRPNAVGHAEKCPLETKERQQSRRTYNTAALALAARMKIRAEERIRIARDFSISLASTAADAKQKELASGFFFAYQRLSEKEGLQLNAELATLKPKAMREKVLELTNPFIRIGFREGMRQGRAEGIRQGRAEGMDRGRREGEVELVLCQLNRRIGAISASQERAIRKLDLARIEALGESLLEFESRVDLTRWLERNNS